MLKIKKDRYRRLFNFFVLVLLLLSVFSGLVPKSDVVRAAGSTYYVSTTGSDVTGDGSIGNPWKTIWKGCNESINGDTLYIRGGVYTPSKQIRIVGKDISSDWLTISNYPGENVEINGSNCPTSDYRNATIELQNSSYVRITAILVNRSKRGGITLFSDCSHIRIDNCSIHNCSRFAIKTGDTGISPHNITIEYCYFYDNMNNWSGYGQSQETISLSNGITDFSINNNTLINNRYLNIDVKGFGKRGEICYNEINTTSPKYTITAGTNNKLWGGSGIYLDALGHEHNISIFNNFIYGNRTGISLDDEENVNNPALDNITIYNNIIVNHNDSPCINIRPDNPSDTSKHKNIFIYHNTLIQEPTSNSYVVRVQCFHEQIENLILANNIFQNTNTTYPYDLTLVLFNQINKTDGVATFYNNCYNRTGAYLRYCINWKDDDADIEATAVNASPQFKDMIGWDFHLNSTSPCIDAANPTYAVGFDYDNNPRPMDNGYDIGAYEHLGIKWHTAIFGGKADIAQFTWHTTIFGGRLYVQTQAPDLTNIIPENNSINQTLTPTLSAYAFENNGETFNLRWYNNITGTWILLGENLSCTNGTYTQPASFATTEYTKYYWMVNATDISGDTAEYVYNFQTKNYTWGNWSGWWTMTFISYLQPSDLNAETYSDTQINLTWTKGNGADKTMIRAKKNSYPTTSSDGILIYNNTGVSYNHIGLDPGTHYYYRAWSWNNTYGFSTDYDQDNDHTRPGTPTNLADISQTYETLTFTITKGTNSTHTLIRYNTTTYPTTITSGTQGYNGTASTITLYSLANSTTYYCTAWGFNSSSSYYSISYTTDTAITLIIPTPPSNLILTSYNDTRIDISWTKGTGTYTWITRDTIDPFNETNGFNIYNSTASSYFDTGLNASTLYYYRLYGYTGTVFSVLNISGNIYTRPSPAYNGSSIYNTSTNSVNLTWDSGNYSNRSVVLRKTTGYSTSPSDGTVVQNSTITTYNESGVFSNRYYTVWAFNTTTGLFSRTGLNIPWGAVGVSVYNESNPSQAISPFELEVSNQGGTIVYQQSGCTNTHYIDVQDIPYGTNTVFIVDASGYKQRVYYYDITLNNFYNYSFYLPPDITQGGGGNGTEDCILRSSTDSINISNPTVDAVITLQHTLDEIISVEIYDNNLYGTYGGWMMIASSNYTTTSTQVTISKDVLDTSTTMARVTYYWWYCPGDLIDTALYYLRIVETIETLYTQVDQGVQNAKVTVKRYISTSGVYEPVSILLTDANGYCNLYMIPDARYLVVINKTGYYEETAEFITTPPNQWGQTTEKIFRIIRVNGTDVVIPSTPMFSDIIQFNGTMHKNNCSISIYYIDSLTETTDAQFYMYDTYNGSLTLVDSQNTILSGFSYWVTNIINCSHRYMVTLCLNHTTLGYETASIYLGPTNYSIEKDTGEITDAITDVYGSGGDIPGGLIIFFVFFLPSLGILVLLGRIEAGMGMFGAAFYCALMTRVFYGVAPEMLGTIIIFIIILAVLWYIATKGKFRL